MLKQHLKLIFPVGPANVHVQFCSVQVLCLHLHWHKNQMFCSHLTRIGHCCTHVNTEMYILDILTDIKITNENYCYFYTFIQILWCKHQLALTRPCLQVIISRIITSGLGCIKVKELPDMNYINNCYTLPFKT